MTWNVAEPAQRRSGIRSSEIRVDSNGLLRLSRALWERLGKPEHVVLMTSADPNVFAMTAAPEGGHGYTIRFEGKSRILIAITSVLTILKRYRPRHTRSLPYRWEGDAIMVVDVSTLDSMGGGV